MRVSVVLCTYSPEMYNHFTEAAESVLNQTHDETELVIIVDGNSTVSARARRDFQDCNSVTLHSNQKNRGLLESRNTGAELATGDIVAFIDDDAIAHEDWIEELLRAYDDTDVLAAGGKMVPHWVADRPSFLPEEFYWLIGVTHLGFADGPGEVRNTFGSNISFRRDIFLQLGGFATEIGGRQGDKNLQGGETELCARLRKEFDCGVMYTPSAVVEHKVFDYRTKPGWLVKRAFWQGYSKRAMESLVTGSVRREGAFLNDLLFRFIPRRAKALVTRPSKRGFLQFIFIFVLIASVGCGYAFGWVRYR